MQAVVARTHYSGLAALAGMWAWLALRPWRAIAAAVARVAPMLRAATAVAAWFGFGGGHKS